MSRDQEKDPAGFEKFEEFLQAWSRRDFIRRMGATAAWAAFTTGGLELLEACGGSSTSTSVTPKKGGHVTLGRSSTADIKTFNPVLSGDDGSSLVSTLCFDSLLTIDAKGQPAPLLAESFGVASDGLTYTFHLHKNAKWTDGQPVTADDVVFTYQLMYDPKYKKVSSPRRGTLEKYIESVTATDANTVVIKTKSVFAPFLVQHSGYGIVPKHVLGTLDAAAINTADFNSGPTVTSGAFKFVKWEKGQQVTFARNDNYYLGAPYLDQFILKLVSGGSVAIGNQLKTGEIDLGPIDPSAFDDFRTVTSVTVGEYPTASFEFYAYNQDPSKPAGKFFADKSVRQALLYALDRDKVAKAVYFGHATTAVTPIPPVLWAFNGSTQPNYKFDKAKAESLLDAAGWAKGSDGIRSKGGTRFKIELITNAGNKVRENLIQVMSQQWRDIGVDCTPKPIDFGALVDQIVHTRTFDVFLVGFGPFTDPDQSSIFHSRNSVDGGFDGFGFSNPEVDKLLDDGVATVDRAKRLDIYKQYQAKMNDLVPAPPIVFANALPGVSKRVQGTRYSTFVGFGQFAKDVWVTDGK